MELFKDGDSANQLGGTHDGVFREYSVFNEQGCVEIPSNLGYHETVALLRRFNCLECPVLWPTEAETG